MKKIISIILIIVSLVTIIGTAVGCSGSSSTNNTANKSSTGSRVTSSSCNHSYSEATCKKAATCTICGETKGSTLAHSYGNWSVTKNATCKEYGEKSRTCTVCGAKDTDYISKTEHNWTAATCSSAKKCKICGTTEGSPSAHAFPTTDFKCKTCSGKVTAADYKYIAASDFRSIRNDYSHAKAKYAKIGLYKMEIEGKECVVLIEYIVYSIGNKDYYEYFMNNFTTNKRIVDPEAYYEKLKDRAYGANKIAYMDVLIDLSTNQVDLLKNGYQVDADYLNM